MIIIKLSIDLHFIRVSIQYQKCDLEMNNCYQENIAIQTTECLKNAKFTLIIS